MQQQINENLTNSHIPQYLINNLIYHQFARIGREKYEILLTRGPKLYSVRNKQVVASCDLTESVLKNIECQLSDFIGSYQQSSQKIYDFDICFSYAGRIKHVLFLLKMRDKLVVLTYRNDTITLHKEYENVRSMCVEEKHPSIHIWIEMVDGSVICDDLYRITIDGLPFADDERFSGVASTIVTRINQVKSELCTTKLDIQKYFYELGKELRFGPKTLYGALEERVMLAKFGDIFIRRHNDMLVFGVPVYNCCFMSKRLVENIRVILHSNQLNQFDFTFKLHKFQVDETAEPNFDEILNKDDQFTFPSFAQEWQPSENNNLYPDTAAIIVITTDVPNFIDFSVLEFDCFVEYDVNDDGRIQSLQNFTGKISINSDIFYDSKFLLTFNKNNVYKDLLAVSSTSEFIFIKLVFIETAIKESFYDFLLNDLEFTKTTEFPEEQADNADEMLVDKFDFLSTSNVVHHSTDIYFLSKDSSYWKSTLIRTHSQGLVDELKIYNKCKDKILSLIQSLKSRFDGVVIEFTNPRCDAIKLSVLKHALQKEVDFMKNNSDRTANDIDENFVKGKMANEFETDFAYSNQC